MEKNNLLHETVISEKNVATIYSSYRDKKVYTLAVYKSLKRVSWDLYSSSDIFSLVEALTQFSIYRISLWLKGLTYLEHPALGRDASWVETLSLSEQTPIEEQAWNLLSSFTTGQHRELII